VPARTTAHSRRHSHLRDSHQIWIGNGCHPTGPCVSGYGRCLWWKGGPPGRPQVRRCVMSALLVGYARCSTDAQELTAQRDGPVRLGVARERIYVDHGLTGTNRERPNPRPNIMGLCVFASPPGGGARASSLPPMGRRDPLGYLLCLDDLRAISAESIGGPAAHRAWLFAWAVRCREHWCLQAISCAAARLSGGGRTRAQPRWCRRPGAVGSWMRH
jgi:hypothetical protein